MAIGLNGAQFLFHYIGEAVDFRNCVVDVRRHAQSGIFLMRDIRREYRILVPESIVDFQRVGAVERQESDAARLRGVGTVKDLTLRML